MTLLMGLAATTDAMASRDKAPLCHKPGTPAEKTLYLPEPAYSAHIDHHGDTPGPCVSDPDDDGDDGNESGCTIFADADVSATVTASLVAQLTGTLHALVLLPGGGLVADAGVVVDGVVETAVHVVAGALVTAEEAGTEAVETAIGAAAAALATAHIITASAVDAVVDVAVGATAFVAATVDASLTATVLLGVDASAVVDGMVGLY